MDGVQDRAIWLDVTLVAVGVPGLVGAVVSGGVVTPTAEVGADTLPAASFAATW